MLKALAKFCTPSLSNIDYDSFYIALEEGNIPLVDYFISAGVDIETRTKDADGLTSLGLALWHGQEPLIDFLLTKNANIRARDKRGNSLLTIAAYLNNPKRAEFFLDQGLDIDSKGFRNNTPLFVASWRGNIEVVRLLVSRGANVNHTNQFGNTALIIAAKLNRLDVVRYLCEHGAELDIKGENGNTAIMAASKEGNDEVVAFLVKKGANLDITNDDGDTALGLAKRFHHGESCGHLGEPAKITLQQRLKNIGCEDNIPEEFICPISLEIMDDPVTLSSGKTYDRKCLIRHYLVNQSEFCPLTRQLIKSEELTFGTTTIIKDMCENFVESQEEAAKKKEPSRGGENPRAEIKKSNSSENLYGLFSKGKGPISQDSDDELEEIYSEETSLLSSSSSL